MRILQSMRRGVVGIVLAWPFSAMAEQTPPPTPEGPPPPLAVSDPSWHEREPELDEGSQTDRERAPDLHRNLALGGQWFFVQDKVLPSVVVRGGHRWFWIHAESGLAFSTKQAAGVDGATLGSQFGAYAALAPLQLEQVELHGGLGGDFYWLWGVHGDQWEVALSTRLSAHWWFLRQLGAFGSARAYPVSTTGLELGTTRDGEQGLPVLFAVGMEWRP